MKRIFTYLLPVVCAGMLSLTASAQQKAKTKTLRGAAPLSLANFSPRSSFSAPSLSGVRRGAMSTAPKASDDPVASFDGDAYGFLGGTDGKYWMYTQTFELSGRYYSSSEITVYDADHNEAGKVRVDVPDTLSVNQIALYGDITAKLFDRDDATEEIIVELHAVGNADNNYQGQYLTRIYNLEGELVTELEGSGMLVNERQNAWTQYQRFILSRGAYDDNYNYINYFDIYKSPGWSDTCAVVEHTFEVDTDLINAIEGGAPINFFMVDGKPYYVMSYYEKTYYSGYDPDTYDPTVTEDNHFVLTTWDSNYEMVDSVAVPLTVPDGRLYRFAGFGALTDNDLSRNYYTSSGTLDYVVMFSDYDISSDDNVYSFVVYNSEGDSVKTVCDNVVSTYWQLADIKGHETQMAFMQSIDDVQQVQMVDLPSCTKQTLFPAQLDGAQISTNINRYPKDDDYQYIMSLGTGETDEEGNLIARLGWYDRFLTLDHYTSFNLGPNAQLFTPNLNAEALNPYLFDTDDGLEFIYLVKIRRDDSTVIDDVLRIADEDGTVLREWTPDDEKGDLSDISLLVDDALNPELIISYMDDATWHFSVDFYSLPLSKFTQGGDGTEASPYLVSTVGDLIYMGTEPDKHYKLVSDIDMSAANSDWEPLESFTGTLEGDGHTISNLSIETTADNAGLFGSLGSNSKVSNLNVVKPSISLTSDNQYVGVLAGQALGDTLSNVHVFDASITDESGDNDVIVGGLVGRAALYSHISGSSFNGVINLPAASVAGGLVGDALTSSDVVASAAKGTFTAASSLGGIVGSMGTSTAVSDSRADVTLHAGNTVGGIVGDNSSRGTVKRNIANGTILADDPSWDGLSAGGIVGYLGSDWSWTEGSPAVVQGNVSAVSIATNDENTGDETTHRVVGRTIDNETWNEGETPETEHGLADNYVADTVKVFGAAVTSTDATSAEGATKATDEFNKDFFTSLEYAYGDNVSAPWKGEELPVLFFDEEAQVLLLSAETLTVGLENTAELSATVYGITADGIEVSSSEPEVATVELVSATDETATFSVTGLKEGTTTLRFTAGELEAECEVTVSDLSGIESVTAGSSVAIRIEGARVVAEGASRLNVYSADGKLVAGVNGESVSTSRLTNGVYVIVATAADGKQTAGKIAVK